MTRIQPVVQVFGIGFEMDFDNLMEFGAHFEGSQLNSYFKYFSFDNAQKLAGEFLMKFAIQE